MAAYQIQSKLFEKFARKRVQKFLFSHTIATLNEAQGHSHWYQTVQVSGIYHHTKFERNRPVNVQMLKFFWQHRVNWILSLEYSLGKI